MLPEDVRGRGHGRGAGAELGDHGLGGVLRRRGERQRGAGDRGGDRLLTK